MTHFVLIPGAGGAGWYWSRVVPLLVAAGHRATAIDLPADDPSAGLAAYADRIVEAIDGDPDTAVVAMSLGGFTAPLVAARVPLRMLVFVNAMIPMPGETAGAWWDNTGSEAARTEAARAAGYDAGFDLHTYFLHDIPPEVAAEGEKHERPEVEIAFAEPCAFDAWPDIPIHAIAGRDDRFFPAAFQRRVARERLGVEIDVLPGGHLMALAHPRPLADRLLSYLDV